MDRGALNMDIILTPEQAQFVLNFACGKHSFEFPVTKRVLGATPESGRDYKPDPSGRSAIELAYHIVNSDKWFLNSIVSGSFDWGGAETVPEGTTFESLVADYDKSMPALFEQVKALPAEKLIRQINFFGMMNNSAVTYLRIMSDHMIHHRGQLSTYIRPAGGKVPSIYGGSFDEPMS
jgi:uncharacterized damage-inducible protein DinB